MKSIMKTMYPPSYHKLFFKVLRACLVYNLLTSAGIALSQNNYKYMPHTTVQLQMQAEVGNE